MRLYVDGDLVASGGASTTPGRVPPDGMDPLFLTNRPLSENDLQLIMAATRPGTP